MNVLRVGTRGSQLALWQARTFSAAVKRTGGPPAEICVIKTSGDRLAQAPLSQVGGKRLFVKELEDALLRRDVDVAVHSAKDMPVVLADELIIGAVLPREDPRDALVLPAQSGPATTQDAAAVVQALGPTPRVGTGSVRRIAQLRRLIPQARFALVRGNLDTRLRKIDAGDYDVLVLAAAGLRRLGLHRRISTTLPIDVCVPAPGQGAIAVELRAEEPGLHAIVARTSDAAAQASVEAERALVAALGGGCQVPIGAIAVACGAELDMHALVSSLDGTRAPRCHGRGPLTDPEALGRRLADQLIAHGAAAILEDVWRSKAPGEEGS